MNRSFVILPLLLIGLFALVLSQTGPQDATVQRSIAIQNSIKDFLAGNDCDEVLAYTSGGTFQEQAPKPQVIKDTYKNSEIVFIKGLFLNNGTAVMSTRTKSAKATDQLHTFVLQENQAKAWKVKTWHTSHQ